MHYSLPQLFRTVFLLTFCLVFAGAAAAWTGPSSTSDSIAAPINTGATNQIKNGSLGVNALSVYGDGYVEGGVGVGTNPVSGVALTIAGALQVSGGGTPAAGKMLFATGSAGVSSWGTLALVPDDVQSVHTYGLSPGSGNTANQNAVLADMQANGGITRYGGTPHDDAATRARVCEIITGDANAAQSGVKHDSYYSPSNNYIYIWNGTAWEVHGASSYNSMFDDITCTKAGGLQASLDSGQTVSY